jgi:hypothetical protein
LPEYLYSWLISDNYDRIDDPYVISATALMKPVRATVLSVRHAEDLEIDVIDLVSSRYGSAIHDSVERIKTPGVDKETRVFREITIGTTKYNVSGKYDILVDNGNETHTLRDMKSTSVWAYIYGGKDEDYRTQLSIYRWILAPQKEITDDAFIDFFFTLQMYSCLLYSYYYFYY